MSFVLIHSLFAERIPEDLLQTFQTSVYAGVRGNIKRNQGWYGDDMCASYSNVSQTNATTLVLTTAVLYALRDFGLHGRSHAGSGTAGPI